MTRLRAPLFLLLAVLLSLSLSGASPAVIPIRRYDTYGTIAKVTPASKAEEENGVLLTLKLKDSDKVIQVMKKTDLHRQEGKRVPEAKPADLKEGQRVSIWLRGKSDKAEAVLIFP